MHVSKNIYLTFAMLDDSNSSNINNNMQASIALDEPRFFDISGTRER